MKRQETIDAIIAECYAQGITKPEAIQYVLATVQHETNDTFRPVREAYWVRDKMDKKYGEDKGAKRFENWAKKEKNISKYWPYYGRGFVQITWEENYQKFSTILSSKYGAKIDLISMPELAMNEELSIFVLVYGMKHGIFTGKKIDDYFGKQGSNFIDARRIINGTDKAKKIAILAQSVAIV